MLNYSQKSPLSRTSGGADATIVLWAAEDVTPIGAIMTPSCIGVLTFMGDSHVVLAGVFHQGVIAYDCIDGQPLEQVSSQKYAVWGLVYGTCSVQWRYCGYSRLSLQRHHTDDEVDEEPEQPKPEPERGVYLLGGLTRHSFTHLIFVVRPAPAQGRHRANAIIDKYVPTIEGGRLSWTGRQSGTVRTSAVTIPSIVLSDITEDEGELGLMWFEFS
jgi:hypothetical protein